MIKHFFNMRQSSIDAIRKIKPPFGYNGFGEVMFYRTYSRKKKDESAENYHDTVVRVMNGVMSIRKDWYKKNYIEWDEEYHQDYAAKMSLSMTNMHWLPPGRGLWAMGTQFIYERGSMALFNCGYTRLKAETLGMDYDWLMDALMCGVGVGFEAVRDECNFIRPIGSYVHVISDDREGWTQSVKMLINSFLNEGSRLPVFNYDLIRKAGEPIRGFGGTSSGPEPLRILHAQIIAILSRAVSDPYFDIVRLKTDIANLIAKCVVAGNVRRSAQLAKGSIQDKVFMNLKDYDLYPDRVAYGGMSNNSVTLCEDSDYEQLEEIAKRVVTRGEPGFMNLRNFKYGRIGKENDRKYFNLIEDEADGLNPCGEITLQDKELCNVVETGPTKCNNLQQWLKACEYATFYATTVSLLPTHRKETNLIIGKNRRIGVGIVDWTGWIHNTSMNYVTRAMRDGYKLVRQVNKRLSDEAGVPAANKVTTIKPGGTTPKLMGRTPGIGYPTFKYTLRRFRIGSNSPICAILNKHNVPCEPEFYDPKGTLVYSFPIIQGPSDPADKISIWEQFTNLAIVQREWADNAVSNTIYFKPAWELNLATSDIKEIENYLHENKIHIGENYISRHSFGQGDNYFLNDTVKITYLNDWYELFVWNPNHEEGQIGKALGAYIPVLKSGSLLPHSLKGAYKQMPEEGITEEQYNLLLSKIKLPFDWSSLKGSDGIDETLCTGDACEVRINH